jgi:hypothetical protein
LLAALHAAGLFSNFTHSQLFDFKGIRESAAQISFDCPKESYKEKDT